MTFVIHFADVPPDVVTDHCAPCYYLHLKVRALNGGTDKLTRRELDFVGCYEPRPPERGWFRPDDFRILVHDPVGEWLDDEDSATLHALMAISQVHELGRERVRFLGG